MEETVEQTRARIRRKLDQMEREFYKHKEDVQEPLNPSQMTRKERKQLKKKRKKA